MHFIIKVWYLSFTFHSGFLVVSSSFVVFCILTIPFLFICLEGIIILQFL